MSCKMFSHSAAIVFCLALFGFPSILCLDPLLVLSTDTTTTLVRLSWIILLLWPPHGLLASHLQKDLAWTTVQSANGLSSHWAFKNAHGGRRAAAAGASRGLSPFPSLAGGGGRSGAGRAPLPLPPATSPRKPSRAARSLRRKTVPARIWLVDSRRFSLSRKMPKSKLDKRRNKDMTRRLLPKLP